MKYTQEIIVKTSLGLHARPAMEVVQILQRSQSKARITYDQRTIDAQSIISLLSLAAPCGAVLTLAIEGKDAKATLLKIVMALSKPSE
ncbi:MAG: HPr family phosphocarrier protein [Simkania sp.]|nr:HPr family phosphocarrier protein [Simkania sp.]